MSDYGDLQDHADAFLALLRGDSELTVYPEADGGLETVPTGAQPPYVAVHFVADDALGGRLSHRSTRHRMRAICHCVGANDIAARAVRGMVTRAVLDVIPEIPGRSVYPIRSEPGAESREDESTGRLVVTIPAMFRLESDPGVESS